jgi:kumamolisin
MAKNERRLPIRNQRPHQVPRSYKRVPVNMSEKAEVTVVVRSKGSNAEWDELVARSISGLPKEREYLTRAAFGKSWGASPVDLAEVSAFGKAYKLTTVSSEEWRRCVVLSGTIANLQKAFGVVFQGVEHPLGRFRTYRGRPQVGASIHAIVEAVLGLDNIPSAKVQLPPPASGGPSELNLGELRQAYSFPPQFRGKGQCVAVIELGGGIYRSDYNEYFKRIGLTPPRLRIRTIGNASNQPAPKADIRVAE